MIKIKNLLSDKTLIKWSLFLVINAVILYFIYFILKNFSDLLNAVGAAVSSVCSALSPLFIGIVIAYLLSPAVEFIDSKILSRLFSKMPEDPIKREKRKSIRLLFSVIITFILIIAVICVIIYGFTILIIGKVVFSGVQQMTTDLINHFAAYETALREWAASLPKDAVSEKINDLINSLAAWLSNSFKPAEIFLFISNLGGNIINFALGVIVSIYILKDKQFFLSLCQKAANLLFPARANDVIHDTLSKIDMVFSQFVRGALIDASIVAVLTSVALSILGVRFAVFIGCFAGIANVIPYFGSLLGMIPAFIVGMFTGGLTQGVIAVVLMLIIQQLDSNLIYPKIVGTSIGLNPLFVLMAITVAGYYGGLIGMVIAVPIAGIIKIFVLQFADWIQAKKE